MHIQQLNERKIISIYTADLLNYSTNEIITLLCGYINDYELTVREVLFWGLTLSRAYKQSITFLHFQVLWALYTQDTINLNKDASA